MEARARDSPGSGAEQVYPGNYEDYLWRKQGREAEPGKPAATKTQAPAHARVKEVKLNPIKLHRIKEHRRELEEEVSRVEGEIAEKTQRTSERLGARRADLEALINEWEQVSQTIEANR